MTLAAWLRYWHTARYLTAGQLVGRLRFRLHSPSIRERTSAPPRRATETKWVAGPMRRPSLLGPARFRFLNEERELTDWDDERTDKLWRYNLHYFDDLTASDARARAPWHHALMQRWVAENPPSKGTGWEPYPTSLRIVNWIKWALGGSDLSPRCAASLADQAGWLSQRLETHLLGNHLFVNAKALVFSGLFWRGDEAARWLDIGSEILAAQLAEQFLEDGAHFELSPMYHAIALEDVLDLCNLAAAYRSAIPPRWIDLFRELRTAVPRMASWLAAMTHPDGEIAFFNDAAFGVAPKPRDLRAYAGDLGIRLDSAEARRPLTVLQPSGYVRAEAGPAVAVFDVARVGPDYLPAHAHADTLSFECSLFGERALVNSGTSLYRLSDERQRQRGTPAHNTVVIDGLDSSEVWAGFRVARRARPFGFHADEGPPIAVRCAHDGYRRLRGKPIHRREWRMNDRELVITDTISGAFSAARAWFHLHPAVTVTTNHERPGEVQLRLPQGRRANLIFDEATADVIDATWHPEFGQSVPNQSIAVRFTRPTLRSVLRWA